MKKLISLLIIIPYFFTSTIAQVLFKASPPTDGPGSPIYLHDEVKQYDFADKADGYWLYEPASPRPDSANVIVFNHGYGGYNPMIYGAWIKHLVRKGNIVIYPRYQKNVYFPRPPKFSKMVSKAIRDALVMMENKHFVQPITRNLTMVGHSYGGVISADLATNFEAHNIPKPVAIMLCSPGTGPLKGGVLDSYENLPDDLKMIVMVSNGDRTVGDVFGIKVFEEATNVVQRNFIRQYADVSISPKHTHGHNESYALDFDFDNGVRNFTARRALRIGKTDNVDYYGYWKIFDALLDCSRNNKNCEYAFGNTTEQKSLGKMSDGTPLKTLEITLPPIGANNTTSSN